ncbi:MAG: MBL fold metallo-hydrolase [Fibrobacter sp.]|nr:MBL fold metallo-hydrolase [Fibrobacter sp.]
MQIQFFGGAQTVTGSQVVISVNGKKILFECGLFQGRRQEAYDKNLNFSFDPSEIDAVILSHAHIDHSGNLPNLIKNGYKGSIYATPATIDLCRIMLRDSAYLQEKDLEWVNKIHRRNHEKDIEPIYTIRDVEETVDHFVGINYDKLFTIAPGVEIFFRDAGHILGSASIRMDITEKGKKFSLGLTGDIGRPGMPLTKDPNVLRELDMLVMESTYGNRLHESAEDVEEQLSEIISETAAAGGKIIIPSFAVGRTQVLVYILHKLFDQNRIPDMPIFVDSPLAVHATEVFREHLDYMDRATGRIYVSNNEDPFGFQRLTYVEDVERSKKLNSLAYPHIIISGSGMAEGGRILHHLRNNIHNPKNLILFVGYAAKDTLARKIMDGNRVVKIFGEEHTVKSKIRIMDSFSAHADRRDLLDYVGLSSPERLKHIFLIHGDPDQALPLKDGLRSKGYQNVYYPSTKEIFNYEHI